MFSLQRTISDHPVCDPSSIMSESLFTARHIPSLSMANLPIASQSFCNASGIHTSQSSDIWLSWIQLCKCPRRLCGEYQKRSDFPSSPGDHHMSSSKCPIRIWRFSLNPHRVRENLIHCVKRPDYKIHNRVEKNAERDFWYLTRQKQRAGGRQSGEVKKKKVSVPHESKRELICLLTCNNSSNK